ncbi:hypothetical protein A4D02_08755 [Niastella koreensis]|uniref:Outer membrane protein beta-barrel domain-containing protein n=2 Tax=Niastella koreensis TaxID=354356 RepID=G8TQ80_NIAKG|nr:hypothetical protein [Niastella koreensis]AEW02094.1 hypothetical protein Niako_5863 [Niastella koreensis GR20-10]OQP48782.1 hypothetical protein A4D02_08755 [Niastella koreensis]
MKYAIRCLTVVAMLLIAGSYNSVQAQKVFFVFAHGQYASPLQAKFKHDYNYGVGAEAGAGINLGSKTFLTGTVGYTVFNAPSKEIGNIIYVPVKLGFRKYFLPTNMLFIQANAGVAQIKDKTYNSTSSRFSGDVGAGVKLGPFEMGMALDGFAREGAGYASWLAFKAGWHFGL